MHFHLHCFFSSSAVCFSRLSPCFFVKPFILCIRKGILPLFLCLFLRYITFLHMSTPRILSLVSMCQLYWVHPFFQCPHKRIYDWKFSPSNFLSFPPVVFKIGKSLLLDCPPYRVHYIQPLLPYCKYSIFLMNTQQSVTVIQRYWKSIFKHQQFFLVLVSRRNSPNHIFEAFS